MRESCSCGAFIATLSRREAARWRTSHVCPARPEDPGPQKQGAIAIVEQSNEPDHIPGGDFSPVVFAKAGFQRSE